VLRNHHHRLNHHQLLQGPKAGQVEPLIEHLPGHPDGIARAADGSFWVALYSPPIRGHQIMHLYPLRLLMAWLPKGAVPARA
jgi:sugar lactone lactonase YvrE